jgi:predicted transcriptional regulator
MSAKEAVLEVLRQMPDTISLKEISEEIALLAAIQRGEEAADAGNVISHEELKQRFSSWIAK